MGTTPKWIHDGGIYFQIPGDTVIHNSPGSGIFEVIKSPNPNDSRIGLAKVSEKFIFDHKIYNLGVDDFMDMVKKTWESSVYVGGKKSLGILFDGVKGSGKTIAAKILANKIGLPVLVINHGFDGIVSFMNSIEFDCIVLIDEAEKTFADRDHELLKLIDGVFNNTSRKLYILTTNKSYQLNDNLLGRPGRIRYKLEFNNISKETALDYINDNIEDKSKVKDVIEILRSLRVSTIDVLRTIVEEVNIHGTLDNSELLNLTTIKRTYSVFVYKEGTSTWKFIKNNYTNPDISLKDWLMKGEYITDEAREGLDDNHHGSLDDCNLAYMDLSFGGCEFGSARVESGSIFLKGSKLSVSYLGYGRILNVDEEESSITATDGDNQIYHIVIFDEITRQNYEYTY